MPQHALHNLDRCLPRRRRNPENPVSNGPKPLIGPTPARPQLACTGRRVCGL